MLDKKVYANGQKQYELVNDRLTYFYKSGKLKAEGSYINSMMEGEWRFYVVSTSFTCLQKQASSFFWSGDQKVG